MGFLRRKKVRAEEIGLFYRQLAISISSGLSFTEAIDVLSEDNENPKIERVVNTIKNDIQKGVSIRDSLTKWPDMFNEVIVNILDREEYDENISNILSNIADVFEKTETAKQKMRTTLSWPFVTLIVAFVILSVVVVFVLPVFSEMYESFGSALPAPTQLVLAVGDIINQNILYILAAIIILAIILKKNKIFMFKILSVVPVAGKTSRKTSALLFVRYLSMMLSVNTPFKEAVICASKVLKNEFYAKKLVQMAEKIKNISELKEAIRSTGIFPKFFLQMIAVGEKSQSIESVLLSLPDIYEKEVDKSIFEFRSFLTGFTMILLGIIVGFIVVALYLPIFMMAGVVGG